MSESIRSIGSIPIVDTAWDHPPNPAKTSTEQRGPRVSEGHKKILDFSSVTWKLTSPSLHDTSKLEIAISIPTWNCWHHDSLNRAIPTVPWATTRQQPTPTDWIFIRRPSLTSAIASTVSTQASVDACQTPGRTWAWMANMKVSGKDYPIYYGKLKDVPNHHFIPLYRKHRQRRNATDPHSDSSLCTCENHLWNRISRSHSSAERAGPRQQRPVWDPSRPVGRVRPQLASSHLQQTNAVNSLTCTASTDDGPWKQLPYGKPTGVNKPLGDDPWLRPPQA